MPEFKEIYRCEVCGNIVEVLNGGSGHLTCCGQPMILQKPETEDTGKEKHVPVVERHGNKLTVKVGSVEHPMAEKHYIQWIDVSAADRTYRVFLKPGQAPEAYFELADTEIEVKEYCNVHGLWKV